MCAHTFFNPNGRESETMNLNLMNIVVRLANIPMAFQKPDIARRLCSNLRQVMEVIPAKGDPIQPCIRVRVQVDISEPLQRGVYL